MKTVKIGDLFSEVTDEFEIKWRNRHGSSVLSTGLKDLDQEVSGFAPGDINVFYSEPFEDELLSVLSINILSNLLLHYHKKIVVFGGELSLHNYARRIYSQMSKVQVLDMEVGHIRNDDWPRLSDSLTSANSADVQFLEPVIDDKIILEALTELSSKNIDELNCIFIHLNQHVLDDVEINRIIKLLKKVAIEHKVVVFIFIHKPHRGSKDYLDKIQRDLSYMPYVDKLFKMSWDERVNDSDRRSVFIDIQRGARTGQRVVQFLFDRKYSTLESVVC